MTDISEYAIKQLTLKNIFCVRETMDCILNRLMDAGVIKADPSIGFFTLCESKPFGFYANKVTLNDSRKIIFATAVAEPPMSLHQFYSVTEAKDMVHQLLIAIAQAEGTNNELSE